MEIRKLTDNDRDAVFRVLSHAFMNGDRDPSWFNEPMPPLESWGVWEGDRLEATATVLAFDMHLGGDAVAKMGGVAGVASLPASRGKGYARDVLAQALEGMRDAGQTVSILFPFNHDFYRGLGWDWVGHTRRYSVPSRALRGSPETERVREMTEADRDAVVDVYTRFAAGYRGMIRRHPVHWDQIVKDTEKEFAYSYVYDGPSGIEGYLTYRGGKREETHIREFLCLTPAARRGLLGLLRRLQMQVDKFQWYAPGDDLLWHDLLSWDLEARFGPTTMGRLVDVRAALRLQQPGPEKRGAANVAVTDHMAPWNAGTWRVEFEGSAVSAEPTMAAADVELDIRALSQAWFGIPTLDEVRRAERVTVTSEPGYEALRDLLAGPPMWISDHF